jgi:serine/threonine protein phosphatase PrpC
MRINEGKDSVCLLGVADGISRTHYGGSVARWLCENHFTEDSIFPGNVEKVSLALKDYLQSLRDLFDEEFKDFPDMHSSGAAFSVCAIHEGKADCFWVGDCPVFHTELLEGTYCTRQISRPDFNQISSTLTDWFGGESPFNPKHVELVLSKESIVTIASDGALCDAEGLNHRYVESDFSNVTLMDIIDQAVERPRSDDASIVACRISQL